LRTISVDDRDRRILRDLIAHRIHALDRIKGEREEREPRPGAKDYLRPDERDEYERLVAIILRLFANPKEHNDGPADQA
jgi:hypothetical protein